MSYYCLLQKGALSIISTCYLLARDSQNIVDFSLAVGTFLIFKSEIGSLHKCRFIRFLRMSLIRTVGNGLDASWWEVVSISLVSGVLMGSISTLKFGLILLRACRPFFFRLMLLQARRPFPFTLCLIQSRKNLDLLTFNLLVDLWLFPVSSYSSVNSLIGRTNC